MLKELNSEWVQSHWVYSVINQKQIRYCIEIEDLATFSHESLRSQIEVALSVWLKPLEALGITQTTITETACNQNLHQLKVVVGSEKDYPKLSSYRVAEKVRNHFYSLVKINTDYRRKDESIVDFSRLLHSTEPLRLFLRNISIQHPTGVKDFASQNHFSYLSVYLSTYNKLIHEFGHGFGLCDTQAGKLTQECDPQYVSTFDTQPDSVMNSNEFFYLTEDDVEGIRALFSRFMQK